MNLPFDRMKAVQAASVIALAEGRRIGKLRLLKLLYITDRCLIKETGKPLLGAKAVAMDHGPLHSDMLNMINGTLPNSRVWNKHFVSKGVRDIYLKDAPDNSALSRHEIETLQDVVTRHENFNDWELSELTHGFEEWKKNFQSNTSTPIPLEDLIDAVGRSDDKEAILTDLRDDLAFDRFFERCNTL
ncbi:MAG: Panacea domain-containing protein [Bythopirellula sp.]|nr:Panacea domain-containing protein [Bythopirellula sp.]